MIHLHIYEWPPRGREAAMILSDAWSTGDGIELEGECWDIKLIPWSRPTWLIPHWHWHSSLARDSRYEDLRQWCYSWWTSPTGLPTESDGILIMPAHSLAVTLDRCTYTTYASSLFYECRLFVSLYVILVKKKKKICSLFPCVLSSRVCHKI